MTQPGEQVLQALEAAKEEHPDVAHWLEFHRELLAAQQAAEPALLPLAQPVTSERVRARRQAQQPLFTFLELEVDWLVVYGLLNQLDEIAARGLPDWPAGKGVGIGEETVRAWYEGRGPIRGEASGKSAFISVETWSPACLAPTAFLVNQALRPFLHRAAEAASPHLSPDAYRHWARCPVCGGQPDFATLHQESGARMLFCNRCDTGWRYKRIGCPFCDTENPRKVAYYPSADGVYRLYVCDECGGYLKTLDMRETFGLFALQVERVLTAGMDVAAAEAGYRSSAGIGNLSHGDND